MKNNNLNQKKDLKIRAYYFALNAIKFIDSTDKKDFTNFFSYALKSANESKFWLGLLRDSGKANKEQSNILLQETTELANILGSSILTLKGKNKF